MSQYTRGLSLTVLALAAMAACGGDKGARKDTGLAADSTLGRDLSLAGADTTAQPQLQDVPAAGAAPAAPAPAPTRVTTPSTKPTTTRPAPRPSTTTRPSGGGAAPAPAPSTGGTGASGAGKVGSIAAGTSLHLASQSEVCTNNKSVGQTFTARVTQSVTGTNGATIPAGAIVTLEITRLKRSENQNDPIVMEFAVRSVAFGGNTYPLSASVASADVARVKNQPSSKDAQKVATGAAVGAIVGQVIGKNTKSTVIGGAVGAAAGAAAAKVTANYEGCVHDGNAIVITLRDAVQVKA